MRRAPRVPVRPDERRSARISPHVSSRPAILVGSAEGAAVSGPPVRRRLGPGCCYQTPERRKDPWAINSLLCAMPHGDMPAGSVFLAGTGRSLSPPIASVRCRLSDFDHVREPFFAVRIVTRSGWSGSACDGWAKVAGRSPAAIRGRRAIFRIVDIDYAIGARRSQPTAGYQPTYLSCATQSRRSMTADPASHLRARLHIRRGAGHGGRTTG